MANICNSCHTQSALAVQDINKLSNVWGAGRLWAGGRRGQGTGMRGHVVGEQEHVVGEQCARIKRNRRRETDRLRSLSVSRQGEPHPAAVSSPHAAVSPPRDGQIAGAVGFASGGAASSCGFAVSHCGFATARRTDCGYCRFRVRGSRLQLRFRRLPSLFRRRETDRLRSLSVSRQGEPHPAAV